MDANFRAIGVCLKNGVPFDVAHALLPHELLAYFVLFGQLEGGEWDWDSLTWVRRD